jgi:iron complex transport system substrate-binding protein
MMRRAFCLLLIGVLFGIHGLGPADARMVTDSAGRQVNVPDRVTRVFAAGPPAATMLYVLAPKLMVGWVHAPTAAANSFLPPAAAGLPQTGRLTGQGNNVNLQALKAAKPDLIVDFGTINDSYKALADHIQAETGIPYLLIDGSLDKTPAALRQLGDILGVQPRSEELASAAEKILANVDHILAEVPAAQRPHVYLARGKDGLETGRHGSITTEIIERAGGTNVAGDTDGTGDLLKTTPDQIIGWAPDTIITLDRDFQQKILAVKAWRPIPAIRNGRVFLAPSLPFGFIDEPPSVNRLIGLTWLMHVFYPGVATGDLHQQVRDFYHLFYQVDLGDKRLRGLLEGSSSAGP